MVIFLRDWQQNNIHEQSLKMIDNTFFEGRQTENPSLVRHGVYAYSSKDWDKIKDEIAKESKECKMAPVQEK